MKNSLSYLSIILILSISCTKATKSQHISDDLKTLKYLKEVEWPKAYADQDTMLLDRILDEDFKLIDNNGNWTSKNDEIEWIKQNRIQHDSFVYEIKRLEIFENNFAIISGTGHITNDGIKAIYQSSNILVKRNNIWKAISSHVSGYKILK
ncbi:DUF4440 domain-containing protein [Tenacibaculum sp. MEBiC06402]|uniref:DUF4440 domain-containing protein n=1 Tax=unclassified Tenacibaculum TaxID=2635139 RepID=UPI003B9942EA